MLNRVWVVLLAGLCVFSELGWAARDVSQLHLEPGDGTWSLGFGMRNGTFAYVGEDTEGDFMPLITYSGEHFFIDGTRAGFHLFNNDDWLVGTYVAYRFGGFNEEDSSELEGLDRDDGVDGRFAITRKSDLGRFTLDVGSDISDKSEGWDAKFFGVKRIQHQFADHKTDKTFLSETVKKDKQKNT